ncbi:pca operon transcription factor PcaQ [Devosia sp. WQ 349]|uniref:pca operon transcription factor PcaQ n=1 Tax=Devosia sp. WQ 349K1 TaxID=2800329 RepID=UPI001906F0C4|nr:pca operon transcription factor PcaQ [Devosia sp. WQ 349K1]MBK1795890.1 pca operon transcription factor PcaQ [Devosia sp. WQ 349K1]
MSGRLVDPRIKIRHLVCFLEVVRLRSIVGAAEALNISQPAVTKTVQDLEEILGEALFDRSKRRLALTGLGEVFYRYTSTSMSALRQGIDATRRSSQATTLRVGALPSVSARILPKAVQQFAQAVPDVVTRIITGPNGHLLSLLRTGDVDFVIGRMADPADMLGLSFEHLYSECAVAVVRKDHELLARDHLDLSAVADYEVLLPPPDALIYPLVSRLFLAHNVIDHKRRVETVSDAFARAYVRSTDAIWFISEGVVANDLAEHQLVKLPLDLSETVGPLGFTTRTDVDPKIDVTTLMNMVRERAEEIRMPPNAE